MADQRFLRDEFAMAALPALVSRHRADVAWSEVAPRAYEIADAMREARMAKPPPGFASWAVQADAMRLVDKVAAFNPDAGEIGAGMLANLVTLARSIKQQTEGNPS